MEIDWAGIIDKVPEVAMVVVFVYYALRLASENRAGAVAVMADWKIFIQEQNEKWQAYFDHRDELYIQTLKMLQDNQNSGLDRIAKDIHEQNRIMLQIVEAIAKHDTLLQRLETMFPRDDPTKKREN